MQVLPIEIPAHDVVMQLVDTGTLRVAVQEGDSRQAGAIVHVEQRGGTERRCAATGSDGRAVFENLPVGRYRATIWSKQTTSRMAAAQWKHAPVRADVVVASGRTSEAALHVPRKRRVTVTVVDDGGGVRPGARLRIRSSRLLWTRRMERRDSPSERPRT